MSLSQNRNIEDLDADFRLRFAMAMDEYNNLHSTKIFIVEWIRSKELQAKYVKEWKSLTMESNHLSWKAVDIAFRGDILYPTDDKMRIAVSDIMIKYWIVNGYTELMRHKAKKPIVDKPHYQAVEMQQPTVKNDRYTRASKWKEYLIEEMKNNSSNWAIMTTDYNRDRLHKRNQQIRRLLWIPLL